MGYILLFKGAYTDSKEYILRCFKEYILIFSLSTYFNFKKYVKAFYGWYILFFLENILFI